MIDFSNTEMKTMYNLRGGKGVVHVSNDVKIGNTVVSCIVLPPGSSIGKHKHTEDQEVYQVLEGGAATINGEKRMVAICYKGEEHDCVNETEREIVILSIKSE